MEAVFILEFARLVQKSLGTSASFLTYVFVESSIMRMICMVTD
jgi:hypothetical protein